MPTKLTVEEIVDRKMADVNKELVAALRQHKEKYELSMHDMRDQLDILWHNTLETLFKGRFDGKLSFMLRLFAALGYDVKIEIKKKEK